MRGWFRSVRRWCWARIAQPGTHPQPWHFTARECTQTFDMSAIVESEQQIGWIQAKQRLIPTYFHTVAPMSTVLTGAQEIHATLFIHRS